MTWHSTLGAKLEAAKGVTHSISLVQVKAYQHITSALQLTKTCELDVCLGVDKIRKLIPLVWSMYTIYHSTTLEICNLNVLGKTIAMAHYRFLPGQEPATESQPEPAEDWESNLKFDESGTRDKSIDSRYSSPGYWNMDSGRKCSYQNGVWCCWRFLLPHVCVKERI